MRVIQLNNLDGMRKAGKMLHHLHNVDEGSAKFKKRHASSVPSFDNIINVQC